MISDNNKISIEKSIEIINKLVINAKNYNEIEQIIEQLISLKNINKIKINNKDIEIDGQLNLDKLFSDFDDINMQLNTFSYLFINKYIEDKDKVRVFNEIVIHLRKILINQDINLSNYIGSINFKNKNKYMQKVEEIYEIERLNCNELENYFVADSLDYYLSRLFYNENFFSTVNITFVSLDNKIKNIDVLKNNIYNNLTIFNDYINQKVSFNEEELKLINIVLDNMYTMILDRGKFSYITEYFGKSKTFLTEDKNIYENLNKLFINILNKDLIKNKEIEDFFIRFYARLSVKQSSLNYENNQVMLKNSFEYFLRSVDIKNIPIIKLNRMIYAMTYNTFDVILKLKDANEEYFINNHLKTKNPLIEDINNLKKDQEVLKEQVDQHFQITFNSFFIKDDGDNILKRTLFLNINNLRNKQNYFLNEINNDKFKQITFAEELQNILKTDIDFSLMIDPSFFEIKLENENSDLSNHYKERIETLLEEIHKCNLELSELSEDLFPYYSEDKIRKIEENISIISFIITNVKLFEYIYEENNHSILNEIRLKLCKYITSNVTHVTIGEDFNFLLNLVPENSFKEIKSDKIKRDFINHQLDYFVLSTLFEDIPNYMKEYVNQSVENKRWFFDTLETKLLANKKNPFIGHKGNFVSSEIENNLKLDNFVFDKCKEELMEKIKENINLIGNILKKNEIRMNF